MAIRFIQPPVPGPWPSSSTDFHTISAKLKQVTLFIFLSPLRLFEYRGFKIGSMPIEKFKSVLPILLTSMLLCSCRWHFHFYNQDHLMKNSMLFWRFSK